MGLTPPLLKLQMPCWRAPKLYEILRDASCIHLKILDLEWLMSSSAPTSVGATALDTDFLSFVRISFQGAAFFCSDVTVLMLDRPRHEEMIAQVRSAGARIRLISDGDVGGAIEVAKADAPVDIMIGIGGEPRC
jgi:hypothetical protein